MSTVPWITEAVSEAVQMVGYAEGAKVISSLGASGSPERQKIADLLVAAMAQTRSEEARNYLASVAGTSPALPEPDSVPVVVEEERPKLVRPNGKLYYARKWGEKWDVEVLKTAREHNQFTLLLGQPGTGKTALVEAVWDDLITTVVTGDTMVSGLVGGFIPDGMGGYLWVDGPLLIAVREGRPILIDEILLANPVVLSVLYPLMDGRGFLDVQENPAIGNVQAAEGFFIVGAANPNVPGAKLSEALASRFPVQVEVTTDWELAKTLGVDGRVVDVLEALSFAASGRNSSISWAPQFRELEDFNVQEKIYGRPWAIRNLMARVPKGDLEEITTRVAPLLGGLEAVKPAKI